MNWLKSLFKPKLYLPSKTIFFITEFKAIDSTSTVELTAENSDSGYFVNYHNSFFLLREEGKLEPQTKYNRWVPKSGWTKNELEVFQIK